MTKHITIGVTGHRNLSPEQAERIGPVIKRAFENVMFIEREGDINTTFAALTPLAEGADTIFALEAKHLGIPLQVLLPYEELEYHHNFSTEALKNTFLTIYNEVRAENKRVLNAFKSMPYNELFVTLGHKVVDESDYLVAIWNEKEGNGKGGTADIIAYAKTNNKGILLINPEHERPVINYQHPSMYNNERKNEILDISNTDHLSVYIRNKQREFDAKAVNFSKKYRNIWALGFVTGLVEVLAFSVFVAYHLAVFWNFLLSAFEMVCLLAIFLLLVLGKTKYLHNNYVHNRIIGEQLRIKRFFAILGFRVYGVTLSPIFFSFKEKPEFEILDNVLKLINLSAYSVLDFKIKKERLLNELIIDQLEYHNRKVAVYEMRNKQYKLVRKILFIVFVIAVILHFVNITNDYLVEQGVQLSTWYHEMLHIEAYEYTLLFLTLFIPPTIAACEALKYLYEWEKIIGNSKAMSRYFTEAEQKLSVIGTDEDLEIFLNTINKDMLVENLEWEKYMRYKNEVPT